jgi:hypothetical protein
MLSFPAMHAGTEGVPDLSPSPITCLLLERGSNAYSSPAHLDGNKRSVAEDHVGRDAARVGQALIAQVR